MGCKGFTKIRQHFEENRYMFRMDLGADHEAKGLPRKVTAVNRATPHRSPQRLCALTQRDFIDCSIKALENVGAVEKIPSAKRTRPALAVSKPGSDFLWFTSTSKDATLKRDRSSHPCHIYLPNSITTIGTNSNNHFHSVTREKFEPVVQNLMK